MYQVKDLLQATRMQRTYIITQIQTELLTVFSFLVGHRLHSFPFPTTLHKQQQQRKQG